MKRWFVLFLSLYVTNILAAISVTVEPNPAAAGQDVQLILKKIDSASDGIPDISELEKEFLVVGTQQSHAYQNINGTAHQESTWIILLNPKHAGKITIPSITWGKEKTKPMPLDVSVMDSKLATLNPRKDSVFLMWEVEPKAPKVHEQVKLKLKIYHVEPLLDAKLTPPTVENGLLFSLDHQEHLFEIMNNQRYQVEQYRYIIYPQNQGNLKINGPVLDALEYGMVPTPIHKALAHKTLKVSPALQANWLPVQNLSYQELLPLGKKIAVHAQDTIVRKIEITAQGIPAQLIPDIQSSCGEQCKVYINPPKIDNNMIDGDLYGQKIYEITYLPAQKGNLKIQKIEIPWFNTKTRKSEILIIPSISVEVFKEKIEQTNNAVVLEQHPWWSKIWLAAIIGFLVGGAIVWLLKRVSWEHFRESLKSFEIRYYPLKKACFSNDALAARQALIKWARAQSFTFPIRDLHDIARQVTDDSFKQDIKSLIAFLFSRRADKVWQGQKLWRSFKRFKLDKKNKNAMNASSCSLNP